MELLAIGRAIDDSFSKKEKWTEKEMSLYELLCNKLQKYKHRAVAYRNYSSDGNEIINNMNEQHWYEECKNKPLIEALVRNMEVEEYESEKGRLFLKIRFTQRHPFYFVVDCTKNIEYTKYFVYLEKDNTKGYIAYYNTVTNKMRELPEYDKISTISNIDRYDLIHLVAELLHFYDSRKITSKVQMGENYPVTIQYLASVTS